ncbi:MULTISPECIES: nodulation protein NolB [Mesorhizobium]|uniref:Mlr8763 protein n=2 Tax=Phyllobacteriaceae TaxID=69277 RepID=Q989P6_RHILO|nr:MULTISPECIES: nodulation protein NolB [Mesorhizobium]BAB52648.1 mlr8763 [Mesorhizobium japonicum MAFF 303099]BBD36396.1 nodulation protein NolB [Aminobacter sp. SS-2016]BCH26820.1 nodulation protein NolB [Mesorhizobium sp. L-8-3]
MMIPITSITATLTDCLARAGSPSFSEQAQFERALAHAADSLKNDAASAPSRVPVPPAMALQRAATQMSPLGDRVLQTISAMYPDRAVNSAALDQQVGLFKGALPRPQKLPAEGDAGTGTSGVPQGRHDFETMIAGLRDMYNGVTQVALVSKGVSGITSSVNKLLKEG